MGIKKIAIITTGQPATNPRAVKEAIALADAGYEVTFIYNFWAAWALPFDEKIMLANSKIHWRMVGGSPINEKAKYYFSRIRHKCFRILNKFFPENTAIAHHAASRGFSSLVKAALSTQADLYIAHNIGALPAAALAAKKHHSKYAFDAEDYHRGQDIDDSKEQKRTILLEDKYLPGAAYLTAASPLIATSYEGHYNRPVTVINNVFSKKYLAQAINAPTKPIKLFWFSQTIGKGRGIEDIILAMREMPAEAYSLTLVGKYDSAIKDYFIELGAKNGQKATINFMAPIPPDDVFQLAAMHDVGLALETGRDQNNSMALSNKIFTYLLAGNAVIFSDTEAQRKFYEENKEVGAIYQSGNVEVLKNILLEFYENLSAIKSFKINALNVAATKYNWGVEKQNFLKLIEGTLSNSD